MPQSRVKRGLRAVGVLRAGGFLACGALGAVSLLLSFSLLLAQRVENDEMRRFARETTIGADNDQERVERITRFIHDHNRWALAVTPGNLRTWVSPPPGSLGLLIKEWPTAGDRLQPLFEPPYDSFLKPTALQVYYRGSDCAGTSRLMIRLLTPLGIRARKLSLHDWNGAPRHAVVEARVDGRWVVADPLHGRVYPLADGRLATSEDLQREPWLAEQHLRKGENPVIAHFRGARTMNWQKIPGWMPLLYRTLRWAFGPRVDRIPRPAIAETPRTLVAAPFGAIGVLLLLPPGIVGLRHLRRRRIPRPPGASVSHRDRSIG